MINIKFKKLLKKLFVFNVVTLMSCNLVPSQTIADPINVPVSGDENTTIPLDLSNLSPISVDPDTSTGQNVTLNITINKIEVDPANKEFKTAADFFVKAANLAKTAYDAPTTANWAALASASMEAANHTVSLINDNAKAAAKAAKAFAKAAKAFANATEAFAKATEAFANATEAFANAAYAAYAYAFAANDPEALVEAFAAVLAAKDTEALAEVFAYAAFAFDAKDTEALAEALAEAFDAEDTEAAFAAALAAKDTEALAEAFADALAHDKDAEAALAEAFVPAAHTHAAYAFADAKDANDKAAEAFADAKDANDKAVEAFAAFADPEAFAAFADAKDANDKAAEAFLFTCNNADALNADALNADALNAAADAFYYAAAKAAKAAEAFAYAVAFAVDYAYADTEYGAAAKAVYEAATAARDAVNKAVNEDSGFDYDAAITSAQNAANSIVTDDFVSVIHGDNATHDLWVRLTAKTKDKSGNDIYPAPPNADESTEWVKITNITENKNADETLTSITVSADMGKALMPGDYNVSVILTTKPINISGCKVMVYDMEEDTSSFSLPKPIVQYGDITLQENKDYTVSYTITDANTIATIDNGVIDFNFSEGFCSVTATITGMGDYMGEVEQPFTVTYFGGDEE